jgi:hypothetical protein
VIKEFAAILNEEFDVLRTYNGVEIYGCEIVQIPRQ